jgi:hypothetical protein
LAARAFQRDRVSPSNTGSSVGSLPRTYRRAQNPRFDPMTSTPTPNKARLLTRTSVAHKCRYGRGCPKALTVRWFRTARFRLRDIALSFWYLADPHGAMQWLRVDVDGTATFVTLQESGLYVRCLRSGFRLGLVGHC